MINRKPMTKIALLGATIALTAAACGSDSDPVVDSTPASDAASAPATDAMTDSTDAMTDSTDAMTDSTDAMTDSTDAMTDSTDAMTDSTDAMTDSTDAMTDSTDAMAEGAGAALAPSGPLCSAVPADGAGSFAGMTEDPAATAASNNPALSTLVTAVQAAGLVDTLNSDGPFTIFAPANPAFEAIPPADLDALLADKEALTKVLTYHVVQGEKLSSEDLAGMDSVDTLGGTVQLSFADGVLTLNDGQATVGCADVQTANATVHIIDGVLMPES